MKLKGAAEPPPDDPDNTPEDETEVARDPDTPHDEIEVTRVPETSHVSSPFTTVEPWRTENHAWLSAPRPTYRGIRLSLGGRCAHLFPVASAPFNAL
jgi:hypothetical protein